MRIKGFTPKGVHPQPFTTGVLVANSCASYSAALEVVSNL